MTNLFDYLLYHIGDLMEDPVAQRRTEFYTDSFMDERKLVLHYRNGIVFRTQEDMLNYFHADTSVLNILCYDVPDILEIFRILDNFKRIADGKSNMLKITLKQYIRFKGLTDLTGQVTSEDGTVRYKDTGGKQTTRLLELWALRWKHCTKGMLRELT